MGGTLSGFWREFKEFAVKGNLIDLAVAFVLGVAFTAVVQSVVNDLFMPVIGAIFSDETLAALSWEVGGAEILYGSFVAALINFLLIAWVLFVVIKAYNQLRRTEDEPAEPKTKRCPYCVTDIPVEAVRCPNCTSLLAESPVA